MTYLKGHAPQPLGLPIRTGKPATMTRELGVPRTTGFHYVRVDNELDDSGLPSIISDCGSGIRISDRFGNRHLTHLTIDSQDSWGSPTFSPSLIRLFESTLQILLISDCSRSDSRSSNCLYHLELIIFRAHHEELRSLFWW